MLKFSFPFSENMRLCIRIMLLMDLLTAVHIYVGVYSKIQLY